MNKTSLLCLCGLLLGGIVPAAAQTPGDSAPAVDKIAKGLLMKHGERLIFAPCRDRSYVNVEDVSPNTAVTASLKEFGLGEGKNLYVEFMGKLDGGRLAVSAINLARREARCWQAGGPDEAWRAVGQPPGWTLVAGGGQLRLSRDGQADLSAAYSEIRNADGVAQIVTGGAEKGDWRFRRQACVDQKAGILFGWQAELKVDGQLLRGCAWQR